MDDRLYRQIVEGRGGMISVGHDGGAVFTAVLSDCLVAETVESAATAGAAETAESAATAGSAATAEATAPGPRAVS